jgi:uncharacterized Zn finger protein
MTTFAKTWWGKRFIEGLEEFTEPQSLARGRPYLGSHRVENLRIEGNGVEARVRDRSNPYSGIYEEPAYLTRVEFVPIPEAAWIQAIGAIGQRAGCVARLLFNEMPDEVERALAGEGLSLLPRNPGDVAARCSCAESENPCRHVAGLYLLIAARLDHDPVLLFELRGLSRAELVRRLEDTPLGSALASALTEEPAEPRPAESYFTRPLPVALPETVSPRDFWRGAKRLPAGVEPPQSAAVPGILVRKGGDYPPFWDKEDSFVEVMSLFYEQVRKKAKDWL